MKQFTVVVWAISATGQTKHGLMYVEAESIKDAVEQAIKQTREDAIPPATQVAGLLAI